MRHFVLPILLCLALMFLPMTVLAQAAPVNGSEGLRLSHLSYQGETGKPGIPGAFGIRGAIGTDVNLGIGFGVGATYTWFPQRKGMGVEFGADFFYAKNSEDDSDEDYYATYNESTELTIFGVRVNGLFNFYPGEGRAFFAAGFGFVVASIYWEETQIPKSTGVERPYDDVEGTSAGNIINLGAGYAFTNGLEFRVETPLLFFYSPSGNAATFAPTFTATLQYRFL